MGDKGDKVGWGILYHRNCRIKDPSEMRRRRTPYRRGDGVSHKSYLGHS